MGHELSDNFFKVLCDQIDAAVLLVDPAKMQIVYANRLAVSLMGDHIIGKDCHGVVSGHTSRCTFCAGDCLLSAGVTQCLSEFEHEISGKWYRCTSHDLLDDSGRVYRLHTLLDISTTVRLQESLIGVDRRWRNALENSGIGVWDWNIVDSTVYFSPHWKSMLGYDYSEIGVAVSEWLKRVLPEDLQYCVDQVQRHLKGEVEVYRAEHRVLCKDERYKWVLDTGKVCEWSETGEPIRMMGTHVDITPLKEAEEGLRIAKDAAENTSKALQLAIERASTLAKEAEEASRAKSDFLTRMSHEMRTPLNAVMGIASLLEETSLSEEQKYFTEVILSSSQALLLLINEILDYAKFETGTVSLDLAEFQLDTLVAEVAANIALRVQEKGLEFFTSVECGDLDGTFRGDVGRLRQVLLNLCVNSVKYTDSGQINLSVRSLSATDEIVTLEFVVEDTGIGISDEMQEKIFLPFVQTHGVARSEGGVGLGLTITRQLVDAMGGDIRCISTVGKGSQFIFTVPLPRTSWLADDSLLKSSLSGKRALVCGEGDRARLPLCEMLRSFGVEVSEAHTEEEALRLQEEAVGAKSKFDLVIVLVLDSQRADVDLLRRLRRREGLGDGKLVAMTSLFCPPLVRDEVMRISDGTITVPLKRMHTLEALTKLVGVSKRVSIEETDGSDCSSERLRILVVEDNVTNQKVVCRILDKLGHNARVAENGLEAIQSLREAEYDLVLMDCRMPVMDGLQATKAIRDPVTGVTNPCIPIVGLTAHAIQGYKEMCLQVGMNDFLTKPITKNQLAEALRPWQARKAAKD